MGKERERLNFEWQKSQNEYIFSVTLLLALFAIRNEFQGTIKLIIWAIIFPFLIYLSGWGLVKVSSKQSAYLDSLRDKRTKPTKIETFKKWFPFVLSIIIGCLIIYFAMEMWKEIFLKLFSK